MDFMVIIVQKIAMNIVFYMVLKMYHHVIKNGICDYCETGYYTKTCQKECPNNYDGSCDFISGICKECKEGYFGEKCKELFKINVIKIMGPVMNLKMDFLEAIVQELVKKLVICQKKIV